MLLWTVQPLSALREIEETGAYRCEREKSYNLTKRDSLEKPYQWLMEQMRLRIGPPPAGVSYPVWLWHTWEFERREPDVDSGAFLRRAEDKALLTVDLPENQAALTDFEAWQSVLSGTYVSKAVTEAEFAALEEELDGMDEEQLARAVRQSWENVFLIDRVENEFLTRGKFIQATAWEIRREQVKNARILPANQ